MYRHFFKRSLNFDLTSTLKTLSQSNGLQQMFRAGVSGALPSACLRNLSSMSSSSMDTSSLSMKLKPLGGVLGLRHCRLLGNKTPIVPDRNKQTVPGGEEFTVFYRFPYIVLMRALSRLKIYQTGLMVISLPIMKYLTISGEVSNQMFLASSGLACFACLMLFVMSHYFRRLVGLMSLNKSEDTVRISHLTFWGNRRDVLIPVEEVVPLADISDNVQDIYIKFQRYDQDSYLYYSARFGNITDIGKFKKVFGEHW